jgi:23S rRNA (cytosine1962-C5)-methyltransferase
MTGITVNGYSEGWLRKGFPWVYPAEITKGKAAAGQEVLIQSVRGELLGRGIGDDGFVAVRRMRGDDGPLDEAWLFPLLDRARELRDLVVPEATDAYRLCHAECDGLPGVRIDWYKPFAMVIFDRPSLGKLLPLIVAWLQDRLQPRGVVLAYRRDPRDPVVPAEATAQAGLVDGFAPRGPVRVRERGLEFDIDLLPGPEVGLFPDMRDVRAWLAPFWGGTSLLNTFAHTGAFSVAAAHGGAAEVVSVDLSATALERAEHNFGLNGLAEFPHEVLAEDTFKALDRFRRQGRQFDRVILDPPSFSRGEEIFSAQRDYPRLVAAAARVMAPGGWLIAASNTGEISPKIFDGWLIDGLRKGGREAQQLAALSQPADYASATWFPEGRYLKVRVMRVL